jgi:hypothetical protein
MLSIADAVRLSGLNRAMIYKMMARGDIATTRAGARRLILSGPFKRRIRGSPSPPPPVPIPPTLDALLAAMETAHGVLWRVAPSTLDVILIAGKGALVAALRRLRV